MCELGYTGDDVAAVWRITWHTARTPKRCHACGWHLAPKERYLRHFQVFARRPHVEILCKPCGEAVEAFMKAHDDGMNSSPANIGTVLEECILNGGDEEMWRPMLDGIEKRRWLWRKNLLTMLNEATTIGTQGATR